jgi:hypothetical protein
LLAVVGGGQVAPVHARAPLSLNSNEPSAEDGEPNLGEDAGVPYVFLWVTEEPEAKVLARDSRVIVDEGDVINERIAARLHPDDRVIVGLSTNRWSPAEDFTRAVVNAVQTSRPMLVETAKEWRRALWRLSDTRRLTTPQLQAQLAAVGVRREGQTIEGWIELDSVSPIAPRGLRAERSALWTLIGPLSTHSLDDVISACNRLRVLRTASGRAILQLWKGRTVEIGIDEALLDELVKKLREEVHVYEVEAVSVREVPPVMLGWWIPVGLAERFESESALTITDSTADAPEDEDHSGSQTSG